ncbi:lumenal Hsp70 protein, partial [Serendipita sp. 399]
FEEACQDLVPRFAQPIWDAIASTEFKPGDISSIILAGGISRVPMVQAAIKAAFGEGKIAQNVNADEAAVLGAAFYGASLSRQFKTKEVKVQDRVLNGLDIAVSYLAESKTGGQRTINTPVLPSASIYGAKKVLTFKRKEDFNITLGYKETEELYVPPQILEAEISGVAEALANLTSRGAIDPLVKVTVGISDSGMAVIHDASVYGEVKEETIVGKIKNLFGGGSSSSSSSSSTSASDEAETATASDSTETSSASAEEPTTTKEVKSVPSMIPLEVTLRHLSIIPFSAEEIIDSRKRLVAVDTAEKLRHKKEEARNMLEGYLYRLRDLLDGDEKSPFMLFSKPEERQKLEEKLKENFRWINDGAEDAEINELWSRRDDMEAIEKPIQFRYEEDKVAPKELENIQKAILAGKAFIESALQNRTQEVEEGLPHKYTTQEIDDVKARLKETLEWLEEGVAEQKKLLKNDDPVLISAEMKARGVTLQNHVLKLSKRKTPTPPKKEKAPPPPKEEPKEGKEGVKKEEEAGENKPVSDGPEEPKQGRAPEEL